MAMVLFVGLHLDHDLAPQVFVEEELVGAMELLHVNDELRNYQHQHCVL